MDCLTSRNGGLRLNHYQDGSYGSILSVNHPVFGKLSNLTTLIIPKSMCPINCKYCFIECKRLKVMSYPEILKSCKIVEGLDIDGLHILESVEVAYNKIARDHLEYIKNIYDGKIFITTKGHKKWIDKKKIPYDLLKDIYIYITLSNPFHIHRLEGELAPTFEERLEIIDNMRKLGLNVSVRYLITETRDIHKMLFTHSKLIDNSNITFRPLLDFLRFSCSYKPKSNRLRELSKYLHECSDGNKFKVYNRYYTFSREIQERVYNLFKNTNVIFDRCIANVKDNQRIIPSKRKECVFKSNEICKCYARDNNNSDCYGYHSISGNICNNAIRYNNNTASFSVLYRSNMKRKYRLCL